MTDDIPVSEAMHQAGETAEVAFVILHKLVTNKGLKDTPGAPEYDQARREQIYRAMERARREEEANKVPTPVTAHVHINFGDENHDCSGRRKR